MKVLVYHMKKKSIAIKTYTKTSLLASVSGKSTTSSRPMEIYIDVDVSLLYFRYFERQKVVYWTQANCNEVLITYDFNKNSQELMFQIVEYQLHLCFYLCLWVTLIEVTLTWTVVYKTLIIYLWLRTRKNENLCL